jgi:hypothetical protein
MFLPVYAKCLVDRIFDGFNGKTLVDTTEVLDVHFVNVETFRTFS